MLALLVCYSPLVFALRFPACPLNGRAYPVRVPAYRPWMMSDPPVEELNKAAAGFGKLLVDNFGKLPGQQQDAPPPTASPNRRERRYERSQGKRRASKEAAAKKKKGTAKARREARLGGPQSTGGPSPAAAKALLDLCARDERDVGTIGGLVAELEALPLHGGKGATRNALVGDWALAFATGDDALTPFVTGSAPSSSASSPLSLGVVEAIFHSWRPANAEFSTIEVVRNFGVWGKNSKSALHGKFKLNDEGALSWRTSYMIDAQGREQEPPEAERGAQRSARLSHVSSDVMVLRVGSGGAFAVLKRITNLRAELEELNVADENAGRT